MTLYWRNQAVIDAGIVPKLIKFLGRDDNQHLQFEALWTLTNIASGNSQQTMTVVQAGAVPIVVHLFNSTNEDVREQAAWFLGNVAGDGPRMRVQGRRDHDTNRRIHRADS